MRIACLILLLALIFISVRSVYASPINIAVNPTLTTVVATASGTSTFDISIINNGTDDLTLKPELLKFDPNSSTQINKLPEIDQFSLKKNNEVISDTFLLRSEEKAIITVERNLNEAKNSNDLYTTLVFKTIPSVQPNIPEDLRALSNVQAGIGTNILYSIYNQNDNPNSYNLSVTSFSLATLIHSQKATASITIKNKSEHFTTITPTLLIYDINGQLVKRIQKDKVYILANQEKEIAFGELTFLDDFGRYRAKVQIQTIDNQELLDEQDVYVIPKKTIFMSLGITLSFILIAYRISSFISKKKQRK